jgi:vacuolar iron transporter family protein
VGVILGLANLVADGLSMGASNYLGLKSELEQRGQAVAEEAPWRHACATLAAFVLVGSLPLWGYWLAPQIGVSALSAAATLGGVGLIIAGAVRAPFVRKPMTASAAEMLLVGVAASLAAYLIGLGADRWLR